jgi:ABC-type tungstate transport system permease subunit
MVNVRLGSTTSSTPRGGDTVSAGAFFPQADFEVPQKAMGQHTGQQVMRPPRGDTDCIMVHAQGGFRFLITLLNRPPDATEPDKPR